MQITFLWNPSNVSLKRSIVVTKAKIHTKNLVFFNDNDRFARVIYPK